MIQWEQLFKTFGFSESAAKLYLASLELGPAPVQDLARKIDVSRMTAYTVIEGLMSEGLISTVLRGKKRLYTAESPDRLITFMQARMKTMEGTLKELEHATNELKMMQRGEKPVVKMFEGEEGIRQIFNDIVQTHPDAIFEFANVDAVSSILSPDTVKPFKEQLDKNNVITNGIYLVNKDTWQPRSSTKVKYLSDKKYSFAGDVAVYGNKVALMTFRGKLIGVMVESEEIANTMRAFFKLAWGSPELEN